MTKPLIIFEGPDGSGKTTAALQLADRLGARYIHMRNMPRVRETLSRFYLDAMLPALLGLQPVVMDRCWLSEIPYGTAFRGGENRVGPIFQRMLERVALRCDAKVVMCLPPYEAARDIFKKRQGDEYLKTEAQHKQVYDLYAKIVTHLPVIDYDWTKAVGRDPTDELLHSLGFTEDDDLDHSRHRATHTAGYWYADRIIVGDQFASHKPQDSLYQWPFVSLSKLGCSHWLTSQLESWGIQERSLCWINADRLDPERPVSQELLRRLLDAKEFGETAVALGTKASTTLERLQIPHQLVPHPQAWKRFHAHEPYFLKEVLA